MIQRREFYSLREMNRFLDKVEPEVWSFHYSEDGTYVLVWREEDT